MLRLLLGKNWTQNREVLLQRISDDVCNERGNRIFIVPELITHDTERRLCAVAGDTSSRFVEVLSFPRLGLRVAEYTGCGAEECLDNGGRVVAMAAAARMLSSKLKSYAAVETRPEFLTGLVDAVDEFKRCCITPADLRWASAQTDGSLAQKLEELALLLETYDSLCAQGKRDPRDRMSWVLEQMEAYQYGGEHVFYIDAFPDFTRQHTAVLEHLIRVSPEVTVSLNCDCTGSDLLAFEKAGHTARELLRIADRLGIEAKIEYIDGESGKMDYLLERLFQGGIQMQPDLEGKLTLIRCESPWQECTAAAERVLELVQGGCRYRDIGIVCADMEGYRALAGMIFRQCGIPVYLSGTDDILEKSVVSAILSAMDAAAGDLEQREVVRYLRSVLSPIPADVCDLVENYALTWSIRGKMWQQDWSFHPAGLGTDWTEENREQLRILNEARSAALNPLTVMREGFRRAISLADQIRVLYQFFVDIEFEKKLTTLADRFDAAGDNRGAQEIDQLWEIILGAMEQMYDVLGNTAWDTDSFIRLFKLLLSQYDVGTIPTVLDSITVGPVSAMRCQQQKHLIVLGAQEGFLPGYGGSTGVLSDQERIALRKLGVPLTGGAVEGLQEEFAAIYGVFCGAEETVTVCCSGTQPSMIYRRLYEMVGKQKSASDTLGAVLTDPMEAAAWLLSNSDRNAAVQLGLAREYDDVWRKNQHKLGAVSRENTDGLYGSKLRLSASQVDCLAECRLSYFLKYGLKAQERKEVTVDPAEFGTFVHAVLEQTAKEVMSLGGFRQVDKAATLQIARKYADAYAEERFSQLDSERLSYLFRRNGQELELVVQELWEELNMAAFEPVGFEVAFGKGADMPPIAIHGAQMEAELRGFVDRVDSWNSELGNYFRIVDYKTGRKDFDYCDVFNGVGLQMLLYLFALAAEKSELLGEHPVPAGVQYFPARVPVISSDGRLTPEDAEKLRGKEKKRKGLLLDDEQVLQAMEPGESPQRLCYTLKKDGSRSGDLANREQLKLLETYLHRLLRELVNQIASGNVEPNPYTRGTSHDACAFCPYGAVCRKDEVSGRRNYKAMTAQRFWDEIGKELSDRG